MEKGTIVNYDKTCGVGMIGRAAEVDVRFYSESIIGGSRAHLKQYFPQLSDLANKDT